MRGCGNGDGTSIMRGEGERGGGTSANSCIKSRIGCQVKVLTTPAAALNAASYASHDPRYPWPRITALAP